MVCKAYMMFLFFKYCLILEEFICFFALGCVCVCVCLCVCVCVCVSICVCVCVHIHTLMKTF